MTEYMWFALGWVCGGICIMWYYRHVRMLRTRSEWYADQKQNGVDVPDDWDDQERDAETNPNRSWK